MKKKQFLQFRRAMATLLAVAMIGQNTVVTTAENFVVDTQAVVAEEQTQEPEVQVTEAAAPAVQEAAPEAEPVVQTAPETPTEPVVQAETETPTEPAAQAAAETPTEPAAQAAAETPAEPTAQPVAETPTEPAAQAAVETPAESAGQAQSETPAAQPEVKPEEPSAPQEPIATSAPAQNNSQEESKPEEQPAEPNSEANNGQANAENGAENSQEGQPAEEAKETLYHVTFDEHAADFGKIQVRGEAAPVENISSYKKEVKENESFAFSVKANDGYEVDHVRFADTQADIQKNADGLYEIQAVTKDEKVTVTYKAVAQAPATEPTEVPVVEEPSNEEGSDENVRENPVTFQVNAGATVTVDGADVTNGTAMAKDGRIIYTIDVAEGYQLISVLVDGREDLPARPYEDTEATNDYITEGISEDTFVLVTTQEVESEEKPEAESNDSTLPADIAADEIATLKQKSDIAVMSILPEETAVATYNFLDADGQTIDTQYITENDTLVEPKTPTKDGAKFIGWYINDVPVTFGTITGVQNGLIEVKPKFEEVHYVFFHNTDRDIVATKEGIKGAEISTADVTFGVGAEQSITGWYTSSDYNTETRVDKVTLGESNIDLYAKVEDGFWVTYDSNGGSYVAPQFYLAGQTATLTKKVTKIGYSFSGWFDKDGKEIENTDKTVKVTARWEVNKNAEYKVVYWQQKVTDDKDAKDADKTYAYVKTKKLTGKTGNIINANTSGIKENYPGFKVNNSKSTTAEIAADGSTIINVYYDRVLCTVNYYVYESTGFWSGEWNKKKTVTGLYGANLKVGEWWTEYYWVTGKNSNTGCVLLTSYDFEKAGYANNDDNVETNNIVTTCNFYAKDVTRNNYIHYYNEQADGSFLEVGSIIADQSGLIIYEKYEGYDLYKYTSSIRDGNPKTAKFWSNERDCTDSMKVNGNSHYIASKLKEYSFEYSNIANGSIKKQVKYTLPLANYKNYIPEKPESVDPNYVFSGWYSDPECTTLFDFNATMPAENIIVYAGWKAPDVTVIAHKNEKDPGTVISGIKYNDTVKENQLPEIKVDETKEVFLGWFTKNEDGSYTPWNFETKIRKNTDLYARVIKKGTFTVSYDANGGSGTVTDARKYAQGAKADIKSGSDLAADGYVFLYWNTDKAGKGIRYYPNDKITIEDNVTLFAIWGCSEKTTLIYDGNGGTYLDGKTNKPQKTITNIKNNEKITLGDEGFTREGYKLLGWSKNQNNSSNYYGLGENIIVNKNEPQNILYAVWEKEEYTLNIKYVYEDGSKASEDYNNKVKFEEAYKVNSPEITGYTADIPVVEGTMPANNLTVTVTYTKRSDYKYTVHYYWNGTTEKVLEDKIVDNQLYNATITESPVKKEGYTPVSEADQTITLDADNKEIKFYYYKNVELTANSDSVTYDGKPHSVNGYTGTPENVKFKDDILVGATGTDAGDYPAEFPSGTVGKTDTNGQYIVSKAVAGNLHIAPITDLVTVTITEHSGTGIYDGNKQTVTGYEVTNISNKLYSEKDFSFNGNATIEGTNAGSYNMELKTADFENISKNFTNVKFVIVDGTLEITKRPVTIEAKASSKVYGNPDPAFELATMNNNVEGELKDLDLTVIRSDAGDDTVKTHKDVLRIDASKEALEKEYTNYTFTIIPADFTILESENGLIVTAPDVVKKYDGNSYGVTATAKIANAEIENPNITIKYWNEKTNAYDLDKSPVYKNVTDTPAVVKFEASLYGYKSVQSEATVTINKRSVTLTSESAAKVYDGTPLTRPDVTIGEDGFVDGEVFDVKAIGSVTNVVDSPKKNAIIFTPVEGKFNADNYAIEQVEGELKITPVTDEVTVNVAGHNASAKYDGTQKTVTGYDITINNKLYKEADIDFSGKATAEGVKADHYPMGLSTADFANNNENFINVKFVVTDGYLDITKRTLTITSGTANKVYDGTPLTNNTITVSGDDFVKGEGATYDVTGTQTEVGFSDNKFTYELNDGTNPANYDIVPAYGTLTVTADQNEIVVTIKGNTRDEKYDGTEKSVSGYEVTSISSKLYTTDDFKFNGTAEIKATDADSYDMGLTAANFENTSKNFENVTFIVTDGHLNIAKRNVTLTSASASKVYDGTPLTAKDVAVSGDGFAKGEGASYDVTGSQLNKGSSANTFEYTLNGNTKKKNYNIVPENGELTVDPVTAEVVVTITENSGDFEYDGTEKQAEGYTVTDISYPVYTEKDFTISENASQKVTATDAGTYDMNLKADDFTNINDNFAKVIFKIVDGTLKIAPRAISIEAGSATKKYDGTPLTNVEYKIVKGLLAAGQTELVSVEGSQTLVGSSANVIAAANIFAEIDGEKVDVTKNYAITPVDGKLEVTDGTDEEPVDPNHVVTKKHDDSKAYDLGDTVIFTISVTNIYDTAKNITITELPGVVLEGAPAETPNILVKNAVPAGETITVKATYTVTEKDVANGSFVNRVKAEFEGGKPFENTDTVTTVDPVRSYTLTKTSSESTHENGMFKAGETIHYTLKVTNTGNQTLENIKITDTLKAAGTITNIQGAEYKQDGNVTAFTISSLAPKAEATITYDYVVQEADKGNTISNAAVGTPANPDDPDGDKPGDNTDNPVENPKLEVKKDVVSITAADGTQKDKAGKADLNDIITYSVTVTNTGNVKLTDVKITDSLEGIQLVEGQSFDIGTLEAGEAKTVTYTYQVKESDLGKSILNTATATGKVPEDPEDAPKPEGKDEKEVPTEDSARSYTITKKSSESTHENGMFKAGETIHYTLKLTNTGNQTLENIEITDTLKAAGTITNILGAEYKQDGKATIFTLSSLAPKAEATITYDYVVQEADKGNTISNAVVGTPANPDDPDGDKPGDNTDNPVENPKLEVKKDVVSITAADGTQKDKAGKAGKAGKADLNDTITYSVTVTNTGNVKLTNVKITDSLEGIQLAEGQSFDIGTLEAGEAKTVTYTYQVKESDLGKSILNTATATGDVPEDPADTPKPEGKDEKEVPTEDPANCSITVTKRLTNIQGDLLAVRAADFYVTLFSDEAMTQKAADTKMIHFDENQGTSSVTFDQLKRGTYYVAETDAEGKVVAEGTYNNGSYVAQYQAGNKVEITENGTAAQFQFDNQFLLLPDEYYIVKTITITKNVLKKNGEDLKSDETFYAGIFKDEDCTQLADGVSQNIVPLAMNGESTATANVEVTVPVGGEEVKLYVTEVTADGTPVALDDTFEYDVEINDGFVTLSETSENAAVTIINTSKKDEPEPTAEPTPEPTEVPAEPTKAPQITQQPEERAVTTNNVKTGDDSPLTQLAFMLFAASAAIMLVVFLRKKDEKDMMK